VDRVPDAGQHRGPDGGPGPRVRHRRLPRRAGRRRGGGGDDGRVLVGLLIGLLIGRRGGVLVRRLLLVARLVGVRLLLFVLVLFVLVLFVLVLFVLVLFVLVLVVVFVVEAGEVGEVRELRVEQVAQRALARLLGAGTVGQQGLDRAGVGAVVVRPRQRGGRESDGDQADDRTRQRGTDQRGTAHRHLHPIDTFPSAGWPSHRRPHVVQRAGPIGVTIHPKEIFSEPRVGSTRRVGRTSAPRPGLEQGADLADDQRGVLGVVAVGRSAPRRVPVQRAAGQRQLVRDLGRDELGVQGRLLGGVQPEGAVAAHQLLEGVQQALGDGAADGVTGGAGHGCLLDGVGRAGTGARRATAVARVPAVVPVPASGEHPPPSQSRTTVGVGSEPAVASAGSSAATCRSFATAMATAATQTPTTTR